MDPWGFLPSPLRQLQATESPLQKTRWMILEEQHLWLSFGLYTPSTLTQKMLRGWGLASGKAGFRFYRVLAVWPLVPFCFIPLASLPVKSRGSKHLSLRSKNGDGP